MRITDTRSLASDARPASAAAPARLCAFNVGLQLVWGAILAVSLQDRTIALGGRHAVAAYAMVAAAGAAVATVAQIVIGAASDRRRARIGSRDAFYAAGVALTVPALAAFFFAPTYALLVVAFLALEIATNVASGPYQAVIPDYVGRSRHGAAAAWTSAYQSIGNAVGLIVAGFVHDARAVAGLLAAGLAGTYAVTAAHVRGRTPVAAHTPPAERRTRGALAALLVSRGVTNVGFFTLLGFLLFFVRDALGVRGDAVRVQTALLFLTFTFFAVAGAALAARPADRYDKRAVVTVALGVVASALVALALATSSPVAFMAAAVAGIGWGAFATTDWALATALLPPGAMATSMGVWNVATTVPQIVAPLLAAPLVVRLDALHVGLGARGAIVLAFAEFVAGAAAVWRLPRV